MLSARKDVVMDPSATPIPSIRTESISLPGNFKAYPSTAASQSLRCSNLAIYEPYTPNRLE
jgi:hypothetical protein